MTWSADVTPSRLPPNVFSCSLRSFFWRAWHLDALSPPGLWGERENHHNAAEVVRDPRWMAITWVRPVDGLPHGTRPRANSPTRQEISEVGCGGNSGHHRARCILAIEVHGAKTDGRPRIESYVNVWSAARLQEENCERSTVCVNVSGLWLEMMSPGAR